MVEWIGMADSALRAVHACLPTVDAGRCLAVRHPATPCDLCVSVCPRSAVTRVPMPRLDPGACDGCGACAAVCPTGAIEATDDLGRVARWLADLQAAPGSSAVIACERASTASMPPPSSELVVRCLGAVRPADAVAAASRLAGTVILAAPDCVSCPRARAGSLVATMIDVTRAALTALGSPTVVERVETPPIAAGWSREDQAVSRRALFGLVRDRARRVVVEVARDTEEASERLARGGRAPAWRRRLEADLGAISRMHGTGAGTLPLGLGTGHPVVRGTCDGCGLCALACPLHAVSIDGASISCDATSCTACGLCAVVCPTSALVVDPEDVRTLCGHATSRPGTAVPSWLVDAGRLTIRASEADRRMRDAAARRLLGVRIEETA